MIAIIGAGPIGSYTAYLLAKKGIDVRVYEEHKVIGKPMQCAGIVTSELGKVIELDKKFIVNRLKKVRVISKHRSAVFNINDIVIDRVKFDKEIADKAKKAGAKFYLNQKYLGIADDFAVFADKKNRFVKIKANKLIGADGPLSDVAKSNRIFGKRDFYIGIQARVKGCFDADAYEVYLGSICADFFAWIVPESSEVARIGVASKKEASKKFFRFLEVKGLSEKDIIGKQAGLIPLWDENIKVKRGYVYLVGDAAGQVKASTGGGLVPGLKAAKVLADCIINNRDYSKGLDKVNKELRMHLRIRKVLNRFSDNDYDELIRLSSKNRISKILNRYNRDLSSELVVKLLFSEPRFLRYLFKII